MDYYVVMLSDEQFVKVQKAQEEINAMPADAPDRPIQAYYDVWAKCEVCGQKCEYGEEVELDYMDRNHTHGIVHPDCAVHDDGGDDDEDEDDDDEDE